MLDTILARPFSSRWIFDVEILARLDVLLKSTGGLPVQKTLYEFPVDAWYEIPGSRLRMTDFLLATVELTELYLRYRVFPGKVKERLLQDHQEFGNAIQEQSPNYRVVVDASELVEPRRRAA